MGAPASATALGAARGVSTLVSLGARVAWIGAPCYAPCAGPNAHLVIFDEDYYVNAARVIAGIRPPSRVPYAHAPLGTDPNAEHPPLAKLIMAGSIELFGNGPFAWRLGEHPARHAGHPRACTRSSARPAAGDGWRSGPRALMAADNLFLVHGRIGTLDVYALAAMVWGAALYLRGLPLTAGVVIGVGACAKEVAPYVLLVLVVGRRCCGWPRRTDLLGRLRRLVACAVARRGRSSALLAGLDPDRPALRRRRGRRVDRRRMGRDRAHRQLRRSSDQPARAPGIASYPWQWLYDYKPITYLNINPSKPVVGLLNVHPEVHFLGMISPPDPALRPDRPDRRAGHAGPAADRAGSAGSPILRWRGSGATWIPFELASVLLDRTSYLYYMLIVAPGVYLGAAYLVARVRLPRPVALLWILCVVAATVAMYPLTPIPSEPRAEHLGGAVSPPERAGRVDLVDAGELAHPGQLAARVVARPALHRLDVTGEQLLESERLARGQRGPGGVRAADLRLRAGRDHRVDPRVDPLVQLASAPSPARSAASGGGPRRSTAPILRRAARARRRRAARARGRSAGGRPGSISAAAHGARCAGSRAARARRAPRARPSTARSPPRAAAAAGSARSARRAGTAPSRRRRSGGRRRRAARRSPRAPAPRTGRR